MNDIGAAIHHDIGDLYGGNSAVAHGQTAADHIIRTAVDNKDGFLHFFILSVARSTLAAHKETVGERHALFQGKRNAV